MSLSSGFGVLYRLTITIIIIVRTERISKKLVRFIQRVQF